MPRRIDSVIKASARSTARRKHSTDETVRLAYKLAEKERAAPSRLHYPDTRPQATDARFVALDGERVQALRKQFFITQRALAEAMQVSKSTIERIERNKTLVRLETVLWLANSLHTTPQDLKFLKALPMPKPL